LTTAGSGNPSLPSPLRRAARPPPAVALNANQKAASSSATSNQRANRGKSGQLYRPMVVAMSTMGMVQPSIHEIIDVVPVGHRFVPAGRAVLVRANRLRRALHGIDCVDRNGMLVNMILVRMMQMALMKIIDMVVMPDRRMPTAGTMRVAMIAVMLLRAGSHCLFPFFVLG
jgi:hypothetical protein